MTRSDCKYLLISSPIQCDKNLNLFTHSPSGNLAAKSQCASLTYLRLATGILGMAIARQWLEVVTSKI